MGLFSKPKPTGPLVPYVVQWDRSYRYDIVGESFHRDYLLRLMGAAPQEEQDADEVYVLAVLEREPTNPHDRNAVRVQVRGGTVGHIPRGDAPKLGRLIADMEKAGGQCCVRARIGGGQYPGAPIGVRLDIPDLKTNVQVTSVTLDEAGPIGSPPRGPASRKAAPKPAPEGPKPVTAKQRQRSCCER